MNSGARDSWALRHRPVLSKHLWSEKKEPALKWLQIAPDIEFLQFATSLDRSRLTLDKSQLQFFEKTEKNHVTEKTPAASLGQGLQYQSRHPHLGRPTPCMGEVGMWPFVRPLCLKDPKS